MALIHCIFEYVKSTYFIKSCFIIKQVEQTSFCGLLDFLFRGFMSIDENRIRDYV